MGRFMRSGNATSMPGQEGIPAVYSPMARTLEDLETFWRAVVGMKPWEYDYSVRRLRGIPRAYFVTDVGACAPHGASA